MSDPTPGPLRVSQWSAPGAPTPPASPAAPAAPAPAPQAPAPVPPPAPAAGPALAVDPVRLLAGLWCRRRWVLAGLLAGALLGLVFGLFRTKTRYLASVQLIKREMPAAFRVGESGEAYRPGAVSAGTLIGAAASANVLQRVSDRLTPRLSVSQLQACVEVKDQRNTDFVFLTLSGFDTAAATAMRANLWAEEVVRFTREMQSQECRETRQFLQQQVDATDTELRRLNDQMLEFAKRENIIDSDKQIDAALRSLGDIDLKYETARINLDTIEFKIKGAEDELRRQSPLADKLRSLRAELDDLRARYTDENPLVVEKREALTTLEDQLKVAATNTQAAASSFTGTELGNTLYLNFIQYQSERQALTRERDELKKLRDTAGAKLDAFPEKAAAYAQLGLRRQSLETARGLLFSRLREAQLFEENAPGYYRVFEPAIADRVVTRGKSMKVTLITALAAALLAAFAATAAAGAELLDTRVRTPREAARVLHAPLFAAFPEGDAPQADAARSVWARWIGAAGGKPELRALWVPSPGNGESAFWTAMLPHAAGLLPALHVVDTVGDLPAPPAEFAARITVERLPIASLSLADTQRLAAGWRDETRRGREVWLRLCGPVQEPGATLARACGPLLVLVRLHAEDAAFWKTQADLLTSMTGRPAGVVALGERNWRDWS